MPGWRNRPACPHGASGCGWWTASPRRCASSAPGAPGAEPPHERYRTWRPVTDIAPGELPLDVVFTLPPGQKLDDPFGVPVRLEVSASPPELLVEGAGVGTELTRTLRVTAGIT